MMIDKAFIHRLKAIGIHAGPQLVFHPKSRLLIEPPVLLSSMNVSAPSGRIGRYTYFANGRLGSFKSIGRFCSIAPDVTIGLGEHPLDFLSTHPFQYGAAQFFEYWPELKEFPVNTPRPASALSAPPVIGNDVWIGARAVIFRGVTIGDGAVIAAGSVVNRDVGPYEIVGGVPAKPIRTRFPEETVRRLMDLKWWDFELKGLEGIPFGDIEGAVDALTQRRSRGELVRYHPHEIPVFSSMFSD